MNRQLWTATLSQHYAPPWPCPVCARGTFALVRDSLTFKETVYSKRHHQDEDWQPEGDVYVFTAWLKCGNPKCGQEAAISGLGGYELEDDGEEGVAQIFYFAPHYCFPMPDVIEIPKKCPDEVRRELRDAFALLWADPGAAAGRLRVALERLMDSLGVRKRQRDKNGKLFDLKLHRRIELFEKRDPTTGRQLMALKWLGNVGSHKGAVSLKDLLDAFEILEHSLAELIDQRTAKVAALAKALTKKHTRGRR